MRVAMSYCCVRVRGKKGKEKGEKNQGWSKFDVQKNFYSKKKKKYGTATLAVSTVVPYEWKE